MKILVVHDRNTQVVAEDTPYQFLDLRHYAEHLCTGGAVIMSPEAAKALKNPLYMRRHIALVEPGQEIDLGEPFETMTEAELFRNESLCRASVMLGTPKIYERYIHNPVIDCLYEADVFTRHTEFSVRISKVSAREWQCIHAYATKDIIIDGRDFTYGLYIHARRHPEDPFSRGVSSQG